MHAFLCFGSGGLDAVLLPTQLIYKNFAKLINFLGLPGYGRRIRFPGQLIENHLKDIISPLLQKFSNAQIILTPQEIKVVALIKDGKSSKEIADILAISETTVNFHRKNLRRKFGLKNRQMNLRSYLISMS